MKIYTSYFANVKALEKAGVVPIGIALYPPRWFRGISLKEVAPSYSIFKHTKSREEYISRYTSEILARTNVSEFIERIRQISNGRDVALLCFEKPGDFCHRRLLADYIKEQTGVDVEEYVAKKKPEYVQGDLFG